MAGEWLTLASPKGDVRVFAAKPAGPSPWPALLVIHAVTGITPHIEGLAAAFARDGYLAFVPDLYSYDPGYREHAVEHIELAAHYGKDLAASGALTEFPTATRSAVLKARDWMDHRPSRSYIETVAAGFAALKARPDVRAVAAIGFCMGGRLVGELAATGAALAAGVIYYGGPPKLELVPNIRCPLEGHYASRDEPITPRIPAFAAAMKAAGKDFAYYVYEADHGFSLSPESRSHNPEATRISMTRAKDFLAAKLKPQPLAGAAE